MPATATDRKRAHGRWPRSRRLLQRSQFRRAYELGVRRSSRHFTLFGCANSAITESGPDAGIWERIGITASRKLGNAVVRNRIRRRTREILRRLPCEREGERERWTIVINPRSSVATAEFATLEAELAQQLDQLRRLLRQAPARKPGAAPSGGEEARRA